MLWHKDKTCIGSAGEVVAILQGILSDDSDADGDTCVNEYTICAEELEHADFDSTAQSEDGKQTLESPHRAKPSLYFVSIHADSWSSMANACVPHVSDSELTNHPPLEENEEDSDDVNEDEAVTWAWTLLSSKEQQKSYHGSVRKMSKDCLWKACHQNLSYILS